MGCHNSGLSGEFLPGDCLICQSWVVTTLGCLVNCYWKTVLYANHGLSQFCFMFIISVSNSTLYLKIYSQYLVLTWSSQINDLKTADRVRKINMHWSQTVTQQLSVTFELWLKTACPQKYPKLVINLYRMSLSKCVCYTICDFEREREREWERESWKKIERGEEREKEVLVQNI